VCTTSQQEGADIVEEMGMQRIEILQMPVAGAEGGQVRLDDAFKVFPPPEAGAVFGTRCRGSYPGGSGV
jgi:hypothetical protein